MNRSKALRIKGDEVVIEEQTDPFADPAEAVQLQRAFDAMNAQNLWKNYTDQLSGREFTRLDNAAEQAKNVLALNEQTGMDKILKAVTKPSSYAVANEAQTEALDVNSTEPFTFVDEDWDDTGESFKCSVYVRDYKICDNVTFHPFIWNSVDRDDVIFKNKKYALERMMTFTPNEQGEYLIITNNEKPKYIWIKFEKNAYWAKYKGVYEPVDIEWWITLIEQRDFVRARDSFTNSSDKKHTWEFFMKFDFDIYELLQMSEEDIVYSSAETRERMRELNEIVDAEELQDETVQEGEGLRTSAKKWKVTPAVARSMINIGNNSPVLHKIAKVQKIKASSTLRQRDKNGRFVKSK